MDSWITRALELGFSAAAALEPAKLQPMAAVREMCAEDRCRAYGKNWTCPPHCGTLEECGERIHSFRSGILLQTVGRMEKAIDTRAYRRTEQLHNDLFRRLCEEIRVVHSEALCLGAGGCRVCETCACPNPCRFPEKALSSMEGYGLFVTQVCRDCNLPYYYGEKTITYTACILLNE